MKVNVEAITVNNTALNVEFQEPYLLEEFADEEELEYTEVCESINNGTFNYDSALCDMIETYYECGWVGKVIMTFDDVDVESCKDSPELTIRAWSQIGCTFNDLICLIVGDELRDEKWPLDSNEYLLYGGIPWYGREVLKSIVKLYETITDIEKKYPSIDNVKYSELESKILIHLLTFECDEYRFVEFEKIRLGAYYVYGIGHPG